MMSRSMQYGAPADPLQRSRAVNLARAEQRTPLHALQDGLVAIAPRLLFVFAIAGVLQMLMHWTGR
ncbi:MAG: hypothetical protein KGI75_05335 [Rhizobiaceae bacterium]|nr:hypothetical protein [Rhizobiaceae bacterium]